MNELQVFIPCAECEICGSTKDLVRHHIRYNPEIIQVLCRSCHTKIHNKKEIRPPGEGFCKYAELNYWFEETENPGYVSGLRNRKTTDLRGYWKITGIRCRHPDVEEALDERGFPLFWCRQPEKCELRRRGEPKNAFSWMEGHTRIYGGKK